MKLFILKYILFVYENYIYEDWTLLTKFGQFLFKPLWVITTILSIIYSIIFFPIVLSHMKLIESNIIEKLMTMVDEKIM